jgi:hypothetical protein
MKIEDYRKADCSLFRIPPVNFSQLEQDVEKIIVNAWKAGYDPNSAITSVVNDKSLLRKIADQISQSLSFQRKVGLGEVETEATERVEEHEAAYQEKVQAVEKRLGPEEAARRTKFEEEQQNYRQQSSVYSASSASLEEMKYRIRDQLTELGGEEGIEALLSIEQQAAVPLTEISSLGVSAGYKEDGPGAKRKGNYRESEVVRAARESVFKKHRESLKKDRLETKVDDVFIVAETVEESTNYSPDRNLSEINSPESGRGFWKTLWGVLNYKIW